jgi:hypothetical protein
VVDLLLQLAHLGQQRVEVGVGLAISAAISLNRSSSALISATTLLDVLEDVLVSSSLRLLLRMPTV